MYFGKLKESASTSLFYSFLLFVFSFILVIAGLNYIWGRPALVWLPLQIWNLLITLGIFLSIMIILVVVVRRLL